MTYIIGFHYIKCSSDGICGLSRNEAPVFFATDEVAYFEFIVEETALAHPIVVVNFANISAAVVVEDDDGDVCVFQLTAQLIQGTERAAGGVSEE